MRNRCCVWLASGWRRGRADWRDGRFAVMESILVGIGSLTAARRTQLYLKAQGLPCEARQGEEGKPLIDTNKYELF